MNSHFSDQGHGVAGRFGGLPDPYGASDFSKIVIQPVPFEQTTTYRQGTQHGPEALIEASRNLELYDIETNSEVFKRGIYTAPALLAAHSEEMREGLYKQTQRFLRQGKYIVTLGGEHSISYPCVKAHAEQFPGLSILQIDAHSDLATTYEGDPWSHACVMARVKEIEGISSIVSVGIRSMSYEESQAINRSHTFFGHELDANNLWMDQAIALLSEEVYLTFDLDGFDSSLMPSTGTPEPGGLFWDQATLFLKKLASQKKIIGFDIVELCPEPANVAPDFVAAKLAYKILSYHFHYCPEPFKD